MPTINDSDLGTQITRYDEGKAVLAPALNSEKELCRVLHTAVEALEEELESARGQLEQTGRIVEGYYSALRRAMHFLHLCECAKGVSIDKSDVIRKITDLVGPQ